MTRPPLEWRFHPERNRLLAEAHARPSTPLAAPALAARIATLSGENGAEEDRAHMAELCRRYAAAEPGPGARWCVLDAGAWRLRWERHTEVSTWTFFRSCPEAEAAALEASAFDLAPRDWLGALPGEALGAVHAALVHDLPARLPFAEGEVIASETDPGATGIYTDFRPGPDGFTRYVIVQAAEGAVIGGRVLQQIFEIETYRLLALLAFPLATAAAGPLSRLEEDVSQAARQVAEEGNVEADRAILARLATLAGEAERLTGATAYRFAAARAYSGLVAERIAQLHERKIGSYATIGDFMERRLAPAMRTCAAVAQRQQNVIERIARTTQLLSTRVGVAAEATNVNLLRSMDERSRLQLRLQETVEGLSVAAISYYAIGLLSIVFTGLADLAPGFQPRLATGLATPLVIVAVFLVLRRIRRRLTR